MASSSGDPVSPFKRLLACCSGSSQNEPLEAGGVRPYSADTAIKSRRHETEAASDNSKLTEGGGALPRLPAAGTQTAPPGKPAAHLEAVRHPYSQPLPPLAPLVEEDAPIPARIPSGSFSGESHQQMVPPTEHPSFSIQDLSQSNSPSKGKPPLYSPDFTFQNKTPEKTEGRPPARNGSSLEADHPVSRERAGGGLDNQADHGRQLLTTVPAVGGGLGEMQSSGLTEESQGDSSAITAREGGVDIVSEGGSGADDPPNAAAASVPIIKGGQNQKEPPVNTLDTAEGASQAQESEIGRSTAEVTAAAAIKFAASWGSGFSTSTPHKPLFVSGADSNAASPDEDSLAIGAESSKPKAAQWVPEEGLVEKRSSVATLRGNIAPGTTEAAEVALGYNDDPRVLQEADSTQTLEGQVPAVLGSGSAAAPTVAESKGHDKADLGAGEEAK